MHGICQSRSAGILRVVASSAFRCAGEGEGQHNDDVASGTAVMMSAFATAGGGVGVAYANTAFRNLGLMEFELADLEGVVVQVFPPRIPRTLKRSNIACLPDCLPNHLACAKAICRFVDTSFNAGICVHSASPCHPRRLELGSA